MMLDVTKQFETEYKNRRYGTIVEHLPIGIVVLRVSGSGRPDDGEDADLVVVDANSNAMALLRRERADLIDRTVATLLGSRGEIERSCSRSCRLASPSVSTVLHSV